MCGFLQPKKVRNSDIYLGQTVHPMFIRKILGFTDIRTFIVLPNNNTTCYRFRWLVVRSGHYILYIIYIVDIFIDNIMMVLFILWKKKQKFMFWTIFRYYIIYLSLKEVQDAFILQESGRRHARLRKRILLHKIKSDR